MRQANIIFRAAIVTILLAGLLAVPGPSQGGDMAEVPLEPVASREISVGLGLDISARTITVKGYLVARGGGSGTDTVELELASAPNVPARLRLGVAALRVLSRATVSVGKHCWRELASAGEVGE